jgi:hypothetical protein
MYKRKESVKEWNGQLKEKAREQDGSVSSVQKPPRFHFDVGQSLENGIWMRCFRPCRSFVKPKTKETTFHANEFRTPLFKLDALFFSFPIVSSVTRVVMPV